MREKCSVVVIGAGIAGLAAARELSLGGVPVVLLEARGRLGGRIHTVFSSLGPVELGAEFVHGNRNATWEFILAGQLPTHRVPDSHWSPSRGRLNAKPTFWEQLEEVFKELDQTGPDQTVQSYLERSSFSAEARQLVKDYVEGFHAAPADSIGVHALARAETAAENEGGTEQFRLAHGYAALVNWFARELAALHVPVRNNAVVKRVEWGPGRARIFAQLPIGAGEWEAERVLVTLPLGVLKSGDVQFQPELREKAEALQGIGIGCVRRVTLEFRGRVWPFENFGFVHASEACLPTWWSNEQGFMLTGWAGGPKADRLSRLNSEAIVDESLRAISELFGIPLRMVRHSLVSSHTHDWAEDPFTRGAYSFGRAGMADMPEALAAPLRETLFFAGEATDASGRQGTVQGALETGHRAAGEILSSFERQGRLAA